MKSMGHSKGGSEVPCQLFFGEWQAVRQPCIDHLKSRFPGFQESDLTVIHGDEASEAQVLEALKTRDLFNPKKIIIYQEPDFLQPRGRRQDRAEMLVKALADGRKERVIKFLL